MKPEFNFDCITDNSKFIYKKPVNKISIKQINHLENARISKKMQLILKIVENNRKSFELISYNIYTDIII